MFLSKILQLAFPPVDLQIDVSKPEKAKPKKRKSKARSREERSLPNEIWKPVVGLEDTHEISSLGRAAKLPCTILRSDGKSQTFGWRLLKPQWKPGGVNPQYHFYSTGESITTSIERLLQQAFNLQEPEKGYCYPRLEPFELPTVQTIKPILRSELLKGKNRKKRKNLTLPELKSILYLRQSGLTREQVANMHNITPEHVSLITGKVLSN